tara:strand:- start:263 stop:766 length:504 start_codon:yes stop_codon:yes gene_type:complete
MDIYKKLPREIQEIIDKNLIKDYYNRYILSLIVKKRKVFLTTIILNKKPDPLYHIYYWFNSPPYKWDVVGGRVMPRLRYISFFLELFPDIEKIGNIEHLYNYYINNYNDNNNYNNINNNNNRRLDFAKLCLNNLSIEELEDLYNYMKFTHYLTNINKCPLTNNLNKR